MNSEKIVAQVNYLKLWIGIFIVTWITLVSYISSNYFVISQHTIILSVLILMVLLIVVYRLHTIIKRKIDLL